MKEQEVMEVINQYFNGDEFIKSYTLHGGFMEYGVAIPDTYFLYALHKDAEGKDSATRNRLNVYWYCTDVDKFTTRELGLMAATSVITLIGYKHMNEGVAV